jgi:hypothetical protein
MVSHVASFRSEAGGRKGRPYGYGGNVGEGVAL